MTWVDNIENLYEVFFLFKNNCIYWLWLIYGIPCYGNGIPFRKLPKFPEPKLRNQDTIFRNTENDQKISKLRKRKGWFRKLGSGIKHTNLWKRKIAKTKIIYWILNAISRFFSTLILYFNRSLDDIRIFWSANKFKIIILITIILLMNLNKEKLTQ